MKSFLLVLMSALCTAIAGVGAQELPGIIPTPQDVVQKKGHFAIARTTTIVLGSG